MYYGMVSNMSISWLIVSIDL